MVIDEASRLIALLLLLIPLRAWAQTSPVLIGSTGTVVVTTTGTLTLANGGATVPVGDAEE